MKRLFKRHAQLVSYISYTKGSEDNYGDQPLTEVVTTIKALKDMTVRPLTYRSPDGTDRIARVIFWVETGVVAPIADDEPERTIDDGRKYTILDVDNTHGDYDRLWCEEQR